MSADVPLLKIFFIRVFRDIVQLLRRIRLDRLNVVKFFPF